MEEIKGYGVDVPVRINIWIRPECQKRQFDVIRKVRPSILFIQSDGGRNEWEWDAIRMNRRLIDEGIDWNCTVYRLYEEENNGLYEMGRKTCTLIWNTVDRCIFLEDDQIPSESFFTYCAELLEKYKNDQRIECICGMNHLGVYERASSDYFFSRQGSIWGIATWKRVIDDRKNFEYGKDQYVMELLKQRTKRNRIAWKRLCGYAENDIHEGHVAGEEFWVEFEMYSQNRVQIIPKYNMISNIGFTSNSAHADVLEKMPRGIRRIFNMKTYEIQFPLNHPDYVIPDIEYEKKRNQIMAYNHPVIKCLRILERCCIAIKYRELGSLIKSLIKKRNDYVRNRQNER
ncbi:MAG: hypothetical protein ACI4E4_03725 [Acetatifactor sp.]